MFWENQQTQKNMKITQTGIEERYRGLKICGHKFLQVVLDNTCKCSIVHWPLEKGHGNNSDKYFVSIDLWVGWWIL